ncbi:arylesterase [Muriicola jejuensis]|uniref:Arylesterase n=2 Tax=Muriicola jejuensis TaxID=504488 RepID=A0A6P0UDX4_9FLAO|nr:arylesterase [Muriicola jejuensis]
MGLCLLISCGESGKRTSVDPGTDTQDISSEESKPVNTPGKKTIVFFGNSLTAGMGLEPEESFPARVQEKIDSLDMDYKVVNAGISGETTAGGESRISWLMRDRVDIFVLELGANDGLRGIPLSETRENLQAIIDTVKNHYPDVKIVLAGMQIPPNMGPEYTAEFREIFPDLARANQAYLIPFLLEDVAGIPELNQADGIHPTVEGQRKVAQNVWEILKPIL